MCKKVLLIHFYKYLNSKIYQIVRMLTSTLGSIKLEAKEISEEGIARIEYFLVRYLKII